MQKSLYIYINLHNLVSPVKSWVYSANEALVQRDGELIGAESMRYWKQILFFIIS